MSFKVLCLFLALGISLIAAQPDYCTALYIHCPECSEVCPDFDDPVCAKYQIPCDYGLCSPPIYKTYPNACFACQDANIISFAFGACEEDCGENEECYEEICTDCEEEEHICIDCEEEEPCPDCEEEEEEECPECEEEEEPGCEEEGCEVDEEEEEVTCKIVPDVSVFCYQDYYAPVCGHFLDCPNGVCHKTFKNDCVACYYGYADWYIAGVCPVG